jgi:Zn-dependent metalloprotease/chitodextrinase
MEAINIDAEPEIKPLMTKEDQYGYVHQKFQQYHNGIKVMGGTQTLHTFRGKKYKITGAFISVDHASSIPAISLKDAQATAIADQAGNLQRFKALESPPELLYYFHQGDDKVYLCYKVDVYIQDPVSRVDVYVDATTGKVVDTIDKVHTIDMDLTGMAKYNGNVSIKGQQNSNTYRLRNQSHKIETYSLNGSTDYNVAIDINSDDQYIDEDPIAVQAHFGAEQTYSFFNEKYGRDSYDDNGTSIKSYVHYSTDYANAFWDGIRMTYGDGNGTTVDALVSVDIVAHEITHGITQYSAELLYKYEAGALNESFSDIFGEAVENFAQGSNDWLMGAEIFVNGGAIRSLDDPNTFNDPDTYMGDHYYIGGSDHGGVHTNSGVQNYWFYLLSQGGNGINDHGDAFEVNPIGIDKAAAIAYRNLTTYLGVYSNYYNAREGAIQAAIDLYGNQSPEVISVTNAWHAVGVGTPYHVSQCYEGALTLNIQFDNYPSETSWSVKDLSGTVIASGGPYSDQSPAASISETINLQAGDFEVVFQDSYGDGMCCGYGDGNYQILIGDQLIRQGAYFASEDITTICVLNPNQEPDSTPPTVPDNLSAFNISTAGFGISWDESSDNVGVTGYHIYLDGSLVNSIPETTYQFNGLNSNTTFQVGVAAYDLEGNTSATSYIDVTTLEVVDTPPSSIPVQVSQITATSALLQWPASGDDGSIIQYHIFINDAFEASSNALQWSLDNLNPETNYSVYVLAEDNAGQLSTAIPTSFTTLNLPDTTPPTIPANVIATDITHESARITWDISQDDSGVMNYDVYLNDTHIASIPGNQFIINGLDEVTSYIVRLRARDIHNNVSIFNQVQFTTLAAPDTQAPSMPSGLSVIDLQSTSAVITYQASTDNDAILGYDIYLDGVWKDFTVELNYTFTGLQPETDYTAGVVAIDESNNESDQAIVSFTTPSSYNPTQELILGSHFETGWEGWIDGGSDSYRYRGRYSPEGRYSIRLRDNSGSKSSMTTQSLDISSYSSVSIEFLYHPYSMENNEDFYVEYHDGSSWNVLARYISGTHFQNNNTYAAEIIMSSGEFNFSSGGTFRIRCDASSNADKVYIDQVIIMGNPSQGINSDLSTVKSDLIIQNQSSDLDEIESEVSVYPNPFRERLYVDSEENIDRVNLYSIEGKLIMSQTEFDDFGMDVSNLKNGIYIMEIFTDGETHHQKLIKK